MLKRGCSQGCARKKNPSLLELIFAVAFWGLLALIPTNAFAQHTVVRDAGGGRKIELTYNASGKVSEERTLDSDGKLQARVEYEYRTGFYVPQQTTTAYFPGGTSVRSVTRVSYDENANFTGEEIDLFNESGAQTGGSKLRHDPPTGIYRCSKWNASARAFRDAECPKSEESAEAEEEPEALTREQVMKELDLARQAQREEAKQQPAEPKALAQASVAAGMKEIGIILPAEIRAGERVSGSVVNDPQKYDGLPGLQVIRMQLPAASEAEAANLSDWKIEMPGESPRPASGAAPFTAPRTAKFRITLRRAADRGHEVATVVPLAKNAEQKKSSDSEVFEASALCVKGELCPVRGSFSGDSSKTFAAFGGRPAPIIVETATSAYIKVPDGVSAGRTHLIVADASHLAAAAMVVAEFRFTPERRDVKEGENLLVNAILSGAEELPHELWRAGAFSPAVSRERARALAPGFEAPHESGEGVLLLVIRNATPQCVSLRGSKDQRFAFGLTSDAFRNGEFKYHFVVEAAKSGSFALQGTILPFLSPVRGESYSPLPAPPAK